MALCSLVRRPELTNLRNMTQRLRRTNVYTLGELNWICSGCVACEQEGGEEE